MCCITKSSHIYPSVLYRSSRDFSQKTMMWLYSHFYIVLRAGTLLRNSECIPKARYRLWMRHLRGSPISCVGSAISHVLLLLQRSYQKKELLANARLHVNALVPAIRTLVGLAAERLRNSIWILINFMPWETTCGWSDSLGLQTLLPRKSYVNLRHFSAPFNFVLGRVGA